MPSNKAHLKAFLKLMPYRWSLSKRTVSADASRQQAHQAVSARSHTSYCVQTNCKKTPEVQVHCDARDYKRLLVEGRVGPGIDMQAYHIVQARGRPRGLWNTCTYVRTLDTARARWVLWDRLCT
jgi:hypothetical protein